MMVDTLRVGAEISNLPTLNNAYVIVSGDTISALVNRVYGIAPSSAAMTFYTNLWSLNKELGNLSRSPNINTIYPGETIVFLPRTVVESGILPAAAVDTVPEYAGTTTPFFELSIPAWYYYAAGVGVLALVGGIVYAVKRKKKKPTRRKGRK